MFDHQVVNLPWAYAQAISHYLVLAKEAQHIDFSHNRIFCLLALEKYALIFVNAQKQGMSSDMDPTESQSTPQRPCARSSEQGATSRNPRSTTSSPLSSRCPAPSRSSTKLNMAFDVESSTRPLRLRRSMTWKGSCWKICVTSVIN